MKLSKKVLYLTFLQKKLNSELLIKEKLWMITYDYKSLINNSEFYIVSCKEVQDFLDFQFNVIYKHATTDVAITFDRSHEFIHQYSLINNLKFYVVDWKNNREKFYSVLSVLFMVELNRMLRRRHTVIMITFICKNVDSITIMLGPYN